jgi:hypothetical protein
MKKLTAEGREARQRKSAEVREKHPLAGFGANSGFKTVVSRSDEERDRAISATAQMLRRSVR